MPEHCGLCSLEFPTFDELVQHDTDCHGYNHNNYFFHKRQELYLKAIHEKNTPPKIEERKLIQTDLLL